MKQKLTPQRQLEITTSLGYIYLLAECIKTEHMRYLVDTEFKKPIVNNLSKRINGDAITIQKELNLRVKEDLSEEKMIEIHRTLRFCSYISLEDLKESNDRLDEVLNQQLEEETLALQ